jgi:hypothetical protein
MVKKILLYTAIGVGALVALFVASIFVIGNKAVRESASTAKPTTLQTEKKETIHINATLKTIPEGLVILNDKDPFGYRDILLSINGNYTYRMPTEVLKHGGSAVALWHNFKSPFGKTFKPATMKVTELQMFVTTTDGHRGALVKQAQ